MSTETEQRVENACIELRKLGYDVSWSRGISIDSPDGMAVDWCDDEIAETLDHDFDKCVWKTDLRKHKLPKEHQAAIGELFHAYEENDNPKPENSP